MALALDGRSVARLIREELEPRLRFFLGMAGAVAQSESGAAGIGAVVFAIHLALEALTQLEGAVLVLAEHGSLRWDIHLTAQSETPLQLWFESFENLPIQSAPAETEGLMQLAVALHPQRFGRAFGSLAEPVLDDQPPEFVERFESCLDLIQARFEGLLLARIGAQGSFGLAVSMQAGTRREDLTLLDRLGLQGDQWRLEQGYLLFGDAPFVPPERVGPSDGVGRIWASKGRPWPWTLRGAIRRIDGGLGLQLDAEHSD